MIRVSRVGGASFTRKIVIHSVKCFVNNLCFKCSFGFHNYLHVEKRSSQDCLSIAFYHEKEETLV